MVRTYSAILAVVWSFNVLPTLCVGGWLEHLCDNHDKRCDEYELHEHSPDGSDCPLGGERDHESDCASDPCAGTVARYERSDDGTTGPGQQPVAVVDEATLSRCIAGFADTIREPAPRDLPLPFHPSDLPLLI